MAKDSQVPQLVCTALHCVCTALCALKSALKCHSLCALSSVTACVHCIVCTQVSQLVRTAKCYEMCCVAWIACMKC
eukprot:7918282-Lingulodinium_polyedra.AAC.1